MSVTPEGMRLAQSLAPAITGRRVLVTGASGFIGRHLCRALLKQRCEVHAVSRTIAPFSLSGLSWHQADLADPIATSAAFSGIEAELVFHLCSYAQGERDLSLVLPTLRGELLTTVNVLIGAAESRCGRLILAGSMEEPRAGEAPSSPYAAAKTASRSYAQMFHLLYQLPVVLSRIFMTYGPGQSEKKVIAHSIGCMQRNENLRIASPGRAVDWIYVEDVVSGLLAIAAAPGLEGKSVDLGSGELVTIQEMVLLLRRLVNPDALLEFGGLPGRTGELVCSADIAATYAQTGWRPSTSLEAGLRKTVESFADRGQISGIYAMPCK